MKTLAPIAIAATLMLLLSNAGYAGDQVSGATSPSNSSPVALAMEQPAVDASVTPGAGPETSSEPISRAKPTARLEMTTPNTEITSTAARQAVPSGKSVNAAYAPTEQHAQSKALSSEELSKRIDALSRDLSMLREDLGRLKAGESETR